MDNEQFKQKYSIILLLLTIVWASFCVFITYFAVADKSTPDILASAGANVLLGALINWMGNVNQFWFRKAKPKNDQASSPSTGEDKSLP